MEPAQSSETTMSERPYLTFRNASRRARGRGMARVATRRRARRVVRMDADPKPRGSGAAHDWSLPKPATSILQ